MKTDRFGKLCRYNKKIQNYNERKRSQYLSSSVSPPMDTEKLPGKVSLCTVWTRARKAGMAVETAMVLPVFLLGLITLISFMELYSVQTVHLTKLCEKVKAAGMYAYVTGGGGPKEITLPDIYTYAPVGGLVSLPEIRQYNAVTVHTWTGREQGGLGEASSAEAMVFVAESGSVYHRKPGCSYIRLSISQVAGHSVSAKRNQYGERYTACETCSQNGNPAGVVYITKSGDRYHNLASCSGLKRTVRMVKESEAKGMGACTRCG